MYDQTKLTELIRFARVNAGSTVIDVYPGDGDWTRLFSDIVGREGRVYSFVPTEVTHFKDDPLGRMLDHLESLLPGTALRAHMGASRDGGRTIQPNAHLAEPVRYVQHPLAHDPLLFAVCELRVAC